MSWGTHILSAVLRKESKKYSIESKKSSIESNNHSIESKNLLQRESKK